MTESDKLKDVYQDIRQYERDKCKKDVCMYCGGRALGYNRTPTGPNDAGNWIHTSNGAASRDHVMCEASAILAREKWEKSGLEPFTEETITP